MESSEKHTETHHGSVVDGFLTFINASVTHFHAVATAKGLLKASGFTQLNETDAWEGTVVPGGKYFCTRNHSTIFAFVVGGKYKAGNGVNIIGAHTDSPNLKLKPISTKESKGYLQVGVEPYGGGLWHTWFDRDLTVAGRVVVGVEQNKYEHRLVKIPRPILRIPNLAIHLTAAEDRTAFKFNNQSHLGFPLLATKLKDDLNKHPETPAGKSHHPLLLQLLADELHVEASQILDFELSVCDTQPGVVGGALNEFIFSARLDNLFMSYVSLTALINSSTSQSIESEGRVRMVALFDDEEVGSETAHGAGSNMMPQILERVVAALAHNACSADVVQRAYRQSFLISADMAHGVHPNYSEKHEENHQPMLQKGVVIKYNGNQRYATTSITAFLLKEVARRHGIPIQEFVVRNDSPCGSTIGPILSAKCGIRTIDIGCPQLSMHSIREMAGVDDLTNAIQLLTAFFNTFTALDESLEVD